MEKVLKASKEFDVRFSEVDSMNIVWHGSYALYFEDAREEFGRVFGLSYHEYIANEYFAPLVDLNFQYKKPLLYGQRARIDITYRNTPAAKVIFDYELRLFADDSLAPPASPTQFSPARKSRLRGRTPPFYEVWKKKYGQL